MAIILGELLIHSVIFNNGVLEYISDGITSLRTYRKSRVDTQVRIVEIMKMRKMFHWASPESLT